MSHESNKQIWDFSCVGDASIKKSKVMSSFRVESPGLSHASESSQPEKSESSTTLVPDLEIHHSTSQNALSFLAVKIINLKVDSCPTK